MTPSSTEVQIHEFSTGIRPERTADGGWVSLGFTGQYMNATIDPIPHAVQRSIANKEFAVAEGASSDEPAIIGRVVLGGEESDWSVVAVVTRGRDEKGRSASVYRYFLCEGAKGVNSLWKILAWIKNYQELHNGEMPVFNPFETKYIEQPNSCPVSTPPQVNLPPETQTLPFNTSAPILIPPDPQYTFQVVDRLAVKKATNNDQPVSWAFNVEALEQPGRFQIIHAASDRAYQLLERTIASNPQLHAPAVDEQAIKSAIKGLISSSKVKPEYVQALTDSLGNNQITESYWKEIFDGQGATNALKQGIYSPQMVRLLTLKAIVIPETLPEYLVWLGNGNKQNDNYTLSDDFQSQFIKSLNQISATAPNFKSKITDGFRLLLPKLLDTEVLVEVVLNYPKFTNGLWGNFSYQVIQDIEHDLQMLSQSPKVPEKSLFKLTEDNWQSILREIKIYCRSDNSNERYRCFAEIFSRLGYYKLAAFFYQISCGQVPKQIFIQIRPAGWHFTAYGVLIKRELTITDIPELFFCRIRKAGSKIVPIKFVLPFVIFLLALLGILKYSDHKKIHQLDVNISNLNEELKKRNNEIKQYKKKESKQTQSPRDESAANKTDPKGEINNNKPATTPKK